MHLVVHVRMEMGSVSVSWKIELTGGSDTGSEESSEIEALFHVGTGLQINFLEYPRHHAHALVVIDSQKLLILLLGYLMGDDLTIDDSTHLVEHLGVLLVILLVGVVTVCFLRLH